ncbi:MAG: T9SS type A sorting domain-containing protein [bacterium]
MRKHFFSLLTALSLPLLAYAQPAFITSLYPPQHGLNIPADAELQIGLRTPLDPASISDSSIYVWSDITGLHKLTVTLENGNKNLRIIPRHWRLIDRPPFNVGERVTVTLTTRLRYADGRQFEGLTWHHTVAVRQNFGGDFKPEALFGGGGSTYFYVSDFNGDGWCDLIGPDDGVQRKMIVFFNDSEGLFQFSHLENIIYPYGGEVVDLDRDGAQEMTYRNNRLILNDGTGHFTEKKFHSIPNGSVKAHDFNSDAIMDFVVGDVVSDTLYFGLSANRESFKTLQKVIAPIRRPTFYLQGLSYDLNNDGRIDFLYVGGTGSGVIDGFVSFTMTATDSLQLLQIRELFYEQGSFYGNDFDGDGDIDYTFVAGGTDNYVTFFNDGGGLLNPAGLQRDPHDTRLAETVEGGDFDGDGDIDLAFASSNQVSVMPQSFAPDVSIYLNDGRGNFLLTSRFRLPFDSPISLVLRAIDLDRDGDLDLIGVANGLVYVVANGNYPNEVTDQQSSLIPMKFSIDPLYPNPATSSANIQLNLSKDAKDAVHVTIFDVNGRVVQAWHFDGHEKTIRFTWSFHDQMSPPLSNGVYFVRARMGKLSAIQKLLIQK